MRFRIIIGTKGELRHSDGLEGPIGQPNEETELVAWCGSQGKTPHNFSAGNVEDHRDVSTLLGSAKRKAHKSKTELWGTAISLSREDGREPGFEKAQKRRMG